MHHKKIKNWIDHLISKFKTIFLSRVINAGRGFLVRTWPKPEAEFDWSPRNTGPKSPIVNHVFKLIFLPILHMTSKKLNFASNQV